MTKQQQQIVEDAEPRWPAVVALLAAGGLYTVLPGDLRLHFGSRYLLLILVVLLLIPTVLTHWRGYHGINRVLGLRIDALVTVYMVFSVGRLVHAVLNGHIQPTRLLISGETAKTGRSLMLVML